MLTEVPVVDIGPFLAGTPAGKSAVAGQIARACREIGFFTIVNHGVPADLVAEMIDVTKAFFDLPMDEKRRVRQPQPDQSRGYLAVGDENLSYSRGDQSTADLKEVFAIGRVDVPDTDDFRGPAAHPSFAPNLWPGQPPRFGPVWTAYYRALEHVTLELMRMLAMALRLPEDHFWPSIDKHVTPLRANHYPEQTTPPRPGQLRAGAHTDYGALTVLLPENVPGGLQVRNRLDEWVDVEAPPGAFVCNLGDLMQRWTNDHWRSTMHRVVNPARDVSAGNRRVSFAFFHQPNYDAVIECLPTCTGPDDPPKYPPISSSEHRLRKYLAGLAPAAR
ncbi:MAG: isopenicillin N synthase family oxygenase [Candidatus Rokubacteria bacterium]|nr:isopenicillin N synthase family oxygenase [Candidatus Rokubacteria bacterium]